MKGKVVSITGKSGILEYDPGKRISFYTEAKLGTGDIVEFEIGTRIIFETHEPYPSAIISEVMERKILEVPQQLRLSKVAGILNVSITTLIEILLKNGFHIDPNPNSKVSEEQFLILKEHFKREKIKKKVKPTYELGTVFESKIKSIIKPSLIILEYTNEKDAFLQLQNIAWNITRGENVINSLKEGEIIRVVLIEETERNAIVSKKILLPRPSETNEWNSLKIGDEVIGTVQEILPNKAVINTELGFIGSVPKFYLKSNEEELGSSIKLILSSKDEELQVLNFSREDGEFNEWEDLAGSQKYYKEDFQPRETELRTLASFKKSIYFNYAKPEEQQFIEQAFQNNHKLFYSSLTLKGPIYFKFFLKSTAWENDFKNKLMPYLSASESTSISETDALKFLSEETYWIRLNTWYNDLEKQYGWVLFNERILLSGGISFDNNECLFFAKSLSVERAIKKGSDSKEKSQRNGAILFNSAVRILSPFQNTPIQNSQKEAFSTLEDKTSALHLLNKLKQESGILLREEGLSLQIFDKFLEFQENNERKGKEENRIFIESYRSIPHTKTEIAIEIDQELDDLFSEDQIDNQLVAIRTTESAFKENEDEVLVRFGDAYVESRNGKSILHIKGDNISLDRLENGFFIERKVSLTQFKIQREVIKDFFDKKINLDHIESLLLRPEKIIPPVQEEITYINPILETTAKLHPYNNQIRAIKKAVGNRNIFLIQGPPGTGKTTIIAEIIGQLVKKGEKVLVTSQTHIGVDNVLEKVSNNKDLTCMRIGNVQRIREELRHFHIDFLIDVYIKDYVLLTDFNINLALAFKNSPPGSEKSLIIELKNTISENSFRYSEYLKDILSQKNFDFLEALKGITNENIDILIDLLKDWKKNIEIQKEYLITPLLYKNVDVVFATCIGIRTDKDLTELGIKFDTVIIDEAGKANLSESLVAIAMAEKVILVGDQMQLSPYIDSSLLDSNDPNSFPNSKRYGKDFKIEDINHALKTSFFEFLVNRISNGVFPEENIELLNYQYRMHPNIGEFISQSFYDGKVKMGEMTYENTLQMPSPFDKEVVFIDTSSAENPYESSDGFSSRNETEAYCIAELIIPKLIENGLSTRDFAIVAPYKSQVSLIKRHLQSANLEFAGQLEVSTLDSFQGMEFDVLVFSFTRSIPINKTNKKVGFLDDARRLNVALSRAKKKLILVGNVETLTNPAFHFDGLFNYTGLFNKLISLSKDEKIGSFVNITDYSDLKSGFEAFVEKNPLGKKIVGRFKLTTKFGHFFNLAVNIDALFYDPFNIFSFNPDEECSLNIVNYIFDKKQIAVLPYFEDGFFTNIVKLIEKQSIFELRMGVYEKISRDSVRLSTRIFCNPDIDVFCHCTTKDLTRIINSDKYYKAKFLRCNFTTKLIAFEYLP